MIHIPRMPALALALALSTLAGATASAQDARTSVVSIYHVAPGKQLAFLKWMAAREAIDQEAGVPATQWYAHLDGDSWDYVGIAPDVDDATTGKLDAMARKKGLKAGPQAGLEFRELILSHTDTYAAGPTTAAELVARVSAP